MHDYCRGYYYQLPSFSFSLCWRTRWPFSLIYIRRPSPCCSFPIPNHPSLSSITFQPSLLTARYYLSPTRDTPDSLASSDQLFFSFF